MLLIYEVSRRDGAVMYTTWVHGRTHACCAAAQRRTSLLRPDTLLAGCAGEQAEKERLQKLAEKHKRKVDRKVAAGAVKKKSKGVRIRKGVKIRVSVLADGLART
jgi:hypothetical protein